jgi:very-short-patch-repair endonuclease
MSLQDKVAGEIGGLFSTQAEMSWHTFEGRGKTESPIETAFAVAFEWWCRLEDNSVFIKGPEDTSNTSSLLEINHGPCKEWVNIAPQTEIDTYRVDFLITFSCGYKRLEELIVECDGHDFHDRTHDQASRDRERDRVLTSAGYRVFRFTGTDINRRPIECAIEIFRFIELRRAEAPE